MSKAQKRARAHKWVILTCSIFAHGFGPIGEDKNQRAFKFAMGRSTAVFAAFKRGDKRAEVIAQLASEWVKVQEQAPGKP